ncbi:MAG TPA: 5-oxoprolinase subunit PxpA [Solirubrobacteraceae bacterium]|nr:5-oxoprolinase subunit PxpA [Solirubrobacteraceae bacterium]
MSGAVIDLNADVGERPGADGLAADLAIVGAVSSVSVACGFHAGDAARMRAVCAEAVLRRKCIGAHVSYLDRVGFGRRDVDVDAATLREHVVQQIAALRIEAGLEHGLVGYVKPHGALYHRAAVDPGHAQAVVAAIAATDRRLRLLGPPGSELLRCAEAGGIEAFAEGFADRAYRPDGTLVPRDEPGAVLEPARALDQCVALARTGWFRSLCLHSDTPGAAELAVALRNRLIGAGFEVRPFA